MEITDEQYYLFASNEPLDLTHHLGQGEDADNLPASSEQPSQKGFKDPLLSQAQIHENFIDYAFEDIVDFGLVDQNDIVEYNEYEVIIQLPENNERPKFLRSEPVPSILKTVDVNTDFNMNPVNCKTILFKHEIFQEQIPASLEMIIIRNGVKLLLRDADDNEIFPTQHINITSSNSEPPVHYQIIKSIILHPICDKTDAQLPQIVTNIGSKVHLCPVKDCTEAFLQPAVAKSHALKHLDIKPFHCTYPGCRWEFFKESHLTRHLITHEKVKNYICDVPGCTKDFTTIYNLNEHKRKRHEQPATKVCPVNTCNKVFRNGKELRSHCKQHNENDAPYKCIFDGCKRAFFFQCTLDSHAKSHQFENTHVCNFFNCGKIFNNAYRLKEHIRSHTGSKPYTCTLQGCTSSFSTASKLKRHEKSHFSDKKFYCSKDGCNRAFKRSDHMKEHIEKTHSQSKGSYLENLVESNNVSLNIPRQEEPLNLGLSNNIFNLNYIGEDSNMAAAAKTDDELLEEAIKSLGVPEMILEEELLREPLDLSDFSTVNLKDLH